MKAREFQSLDEETRALLRRVLERQAYRQRMAANIRGHGIKFFSELEEKLAVATELESALQVLHQVERLYVGLGGKELTEAVRPRMERIPYPASRQELAVCLGVIGRAERVVARCYLGGISSDFASIARTLAAPPSGMVEGEEERFIAFAGEAGNRTQAQEYWTRWMVVALGAMGRPDTAGDERAVELHLRKKRVGEVMTDFLDEVDELRKSVDLPLPDPAVHGIEIPSSLSGRFAPQS